MRKTPTDAKTLARLSPHERAAFFGKLDADELETLKTLWPFWARPEQLIPPGDWVFWLPLAGRGWGKTRTGAETLRHWARDFPLVNLIGATADDVRDVMVEGESGVLAICPRDERPRYVAHKRRLEWPNGAKSLLFSAEEPERLRGKQHMKLWCLTGETLVSTGDGSSKRLDSVRCGDFVETRNGPRRVVWQAMTRRNAGLFRLETVGGKVLVGTHDHPVWIEGEGFMPFAAIRPGMNACAMLASSWAARPGIVITAAITQLLCVYIGKSGKPRTDPFLTGSMCTTGTTIKATIVSIISSCFRIANTALGMLTKTLDLIASGPWSWRSKIVAAIAQSEWSGSLFACNAAANMRAALGILQGSVQWPALTPLGLAHSQDKSANASNAASHTPQQSAPSVIAASAAIRALRLLASRFCAKLRALIAGPFSKASGQTRVFAAIAAPSTFMETIVSVERLDRRADVFDICVEGAHEFFANGLLVHNCDELAAWRYPEAWDQAVFGLRLGTKPQAIVTTTPRPTKLMRDLLADPLTYTTQHSTFENVGNLAENFLDRVVRKYEGTRLGRQELHAHMLLDAPGALWTRERIEAALADTSEKPKLGRIVVAVDPPATSGEKADECGMIVAGLAPDRRVYILADLSRQGETPLGWATRAVAALKDFGADCIVAEVNNGGEMIETLIRQVDANVPYRAVRASRGKFTRAEPVAALYEQGRVRHCGVFAKLEDQMCLMTPDFDRARAGYSPDRVDALVWAVSALVFEQGEGAAVFEFYRNMAAGLNRQD